MSSTISFNLDQSKILSSVNGLTERVLIFLHETYPMHEDVEFFNGYLPGYARFVRRVFPRGQWYCTL